MSLAKEKFSSISTAVFSPAIASNTEAGVIPVPTPCSFSDDLKHVNTSPRGRLIPLPPRPPSEYRNSGSCKLQESHKVWLNIQGKDKGAQTQQRQTLKTRRPTATKSQRKQLPGERKIKKKYQHKQEKRTKHKRQTKDKLMDIGEARGKQGARVRNNQKHRRNEGGEL